MYITGVKRGRGYGDREEGKREGDWGEREDVSPSPPLFAPVTVWYKSFNKQTLATKPLSEFFLYL